MADWRTWKTFDYTAASGSGVKIKVDIDYDASNWVTTLKIRFVGSANADWAYASNGYYILWRPNDDEAKSILTIKHPGDNWSEKSIPSFNISKTYTSSSFTMPEFWICNTGSVKPNTSAQTIVYDYKDKPKTYDFETIFTGGENSRAGYKTVCSSNNSLTISGTKASAVGTGTTTITDHGNNTFTITATKGANGTNNPAGGPTNLSWGYSSSYGNAYTSGVVKLLTPSGTGEKRTVYATSTTTATYGNNKPATASKGINQYLPPKWSEETTPTISYNKNRFTLKENWVFSWPEAEKQGSSNVAGYRIRIFKTPAGEQINVQNERSIPIISRTTGDIVSTDGATDPAYKSSDNAWIRNRYFYDRPAGNGTTMTINPALLDLQPGDQVRFHVYPYSTDSNGNSGCWPRPTSALTKETGYNIYKDSAGKYYPYLFTTPETVDSYTGRNELISDVYTIENAGIVRVKVGSEWKEGQVWVKVGSVWKEAETVNIRAATQWKESQ